MRGHPTGVKASAQPPPQLHRHLVPSSLPHWESRETPTLSDHTLCRPTHPSADTLGRQCIDWVLLTVSLRGGSCPFCCPHGSLDLKATVSHHMMVSCWPRGSRSIARTAENVPPTLVGVQGVPHCRGGGHSLGAPPLPPGVCPPTRLPAPRLTGQTSVCTSTHACRDTCPASRTRPLQARGTVSVLPEPHHLLGCLCLLSTKVAPRAAGPGRLPLAFLWGRAGQCPVLLLVVHGPVVQAAGPQRQGSACSWKSP